MGSVTRTSSCYCARVFTLAPIGKAIGGRRRAECCQCHGEKTHGMLPVKDQGLRCISTSRCNVRELPRRRPGDYRETIHGQGLFESGLVMAATCADCHGAHGIYYAADERSTLNAANVAVTCGACHRGSGRVCRKVSTVARTIGAGRG